MGEITIRQPQVLFGLNLEQDQYCRCEDSFKLSKLLVLMPILTRSLTAPVLRNYCAGF